MYPILPLRKVPKDTQDAILGYLDYTWTSFQSAHIDTVNILSFLRPHTISVP